MKRKSIGKKRISACVLTAVLAASILSGCEYAPSIDELIHGDKSAQKEVSEAVEPETEEQKETEETEAASETEVTEEADASDAAAADDTEAVLQAFVNDEIPAGDKKFSELYDYVKEELGIEPDVYYYDVDDDGKKELLVNQQYYGLDIYEAIDGKIMFLTGGEGTTGFCSIYEGEGKTYVAHSDFSHGGRQLLTLTRYEGDGNKVEEITINAEYYDNEDDHYDENSTFTYNGESITMKEYEKYMDTYKPVDTDDLK
ncbi:hypothetical protein SAMN06296386_11486 [Lachnospiraceae bacterium]|nr:hypothetical protein SAMN06296386_11486 [Lachnospiraceae bacterium]